MATMSLMDLRVSANTLASYSRAGNTESAAMGQLAQIQPQYSKFWREARTACENGEMMYVALANVWPPAIVNALRAGEESGNVGPVLTKISNALNVQKSIREALNALIYPGVMIVSAALMFIGLMVLAVPRTARALHAEHSNTITELAMMMESFFLNYGFFVAGGVATGITRFSTSVRTTKGQERILSWALKIPGLREALIDIYFGLWSSYMTMTVEAGIPTPRGFEMTATILPAPLRAGVELLVSDLVDRSMSLSASVDLELIPKNDPRRDWPPFIRDAIAIGERSGTLDEQLKRVGDELVQQGIERLKGFCKRVEVLATVTGAVAVGFCFLGIYSPIFGLIQHHH